MKIKDLPIRMECVLSIVDYVGFSHCWTGFEELYNGLCCHMPEALKDKHVLSLSVDDSGALRIIV